jgi:hypothetical protein
MAACALLDHHYVTSLEEPVALAEPSSRGRARAEETRDYFAFARDGLAELA